LQDANFLLLKKGDPVAISGFGGFKVVNRKARKGRQRLWPFDEGQ
jgi:nucleoid DNA-binding protein